MEIKQLAEAEWHSILFTPPYSDLQPIEMVWAKVKGNVEQKYKKGINLAEARQNLELEFTQLLTEENSERIGRIIDSVDRTISKFLAEIRREEDEESGVANIEHSPEEFSDLAMHGPPSETETDDSDIEQSSELK